MIPLPRPAVVIERVCPFGHNQQRWPSVPLLLHPNWLNILLAVMIVFTLNILRLVARVFTLFGVCLGQSALSLLPSNSLLQNFSSQQGGKHTDESTFCCQLLLLILPGQLLAVTSLQAYWIFDLLTFWKLQEAPKCWFKYAPSTAINLVTKDTLEKCLFAYIFVL